MAAAGCGAPQYAVNAAPLHGSEMMVRSGLNEQMCFDPNGEKPVAGAAIILWKCHGKESQRWTFADQPDGTNTLLGIGGFCLEVKGHVAVDGTPLQLSTCTGQNNQRFRHNADGRIVEVETGKCLTAGTSAEATPVAIDECDLHNGGQVWTIAK